MPDVREDVEAVRTAIYRGHQVDSKDFDWQPADTALDRLSAALEDDGQLRITHNVYDLLVKEKRKCIAAERALAEMRTLLARQLTPLDVAATHIEIIRSKGGEYSAQERDNVAAIVESHVKEARNALFAALRPTEDTAHPRDKLGVVYDTPLGVRPRSTEDTADADFEWNFKQEC